MTEPESFLTIGDVVRRWHRSETTVRRDCQTGRLLGAVPPGTGGRKAWGIPASDAVALYGPEPLEEVKPEQDLEGPSIEEQLEKSRAALALVEAERDTAERKVQEQRDALEAAKAEAAKVPELEADLRVAEARLEERERADDVVDLLRQMAPILTALAARAEAGRPALTVTSSKPKRWWQRSPSTPEES